LVQLLELGPGGVWDVEVLDALGRVVLRRSAVRQQLDLGDLPDGRYVLRLRDQRAQALHTLQVLLLR
jgi:hypothetical protein